MSARLAFTLSSSILVDQVNLGWAPMLGLRYFSLHMLHLLSLPAHQHHGIIPLLIRVMKIRVVPISRLFLFLCHVGQKTMSNDLLEVCCVRSSSSSPGSSSAASSVISWSPLEPESQSRSVGHGHRTMLMMMLKRLSIIHSR
jgi:hypothetical protein